MDDYISRSAAINASREIGKKEYDAGKTETAVISMLINDKLRAIPAADVAPVRRGRWIKDGEDGPVYCSECGEEHEWGDYRATYCDTCGAKMYGGQDNA